MRPSPLRPLAALVLVLTSSVLAATPAGAVATLTGRVPHAMPRTVVRLERVEGGEHEVPVTVPVDPSGRFTAELPGGSYKLQTEVSNLLVTRAVTVGDGQRVEMTLTPPTNPETPGGGNFSLGVGYVGTWRDVDLESGRTTERTADGTTVTPIDPRTTGQVLELQSNAGFVQATYGVPEQWVPAGRAGVVAIGLAPYVRVGAGTASIRFDGSPDHRFTQRSGASPYVGAGLTTKVQSSRIPVYGLLSLEGYWMGWGDASTSEASASARHVRVDGQSYGGSVTLSAGAQLDQLVQGLPTFAGLFDVEVGVGASWLRADSTVRFDRQVCVEPPASPPAPEPVAPGPPPPPEPPLTERRASALLCHDVHTEIRRDFTESALVFGRVALAFPIYGRDSGILQFDVGDGWWGVVVKFAKRF